MITVRRWYMFLVSSISLNAVVWAIIALLRNLSIPTLNTPRNQIAFEIAVVIIGLPFFLAHWLWIQRLAQQRAEERISLLRQFYLYALMAGFLGPIVANGVGMIEALLNLLFRWERPASLIYGLKPSQAIIYHLVGLLILTLFWEYHRRHVTTEGQSGSIYQLQANPRRLYVYGFSGAGLIMTAAAVVSLIRWLSFQFGEYTLSFTSGRSIYLPQLLVGLPLWLFFWLWANRLFASSEAPEQESALRKLYLYLAIFAGVILAVFNAALILGSGLRAVLDLPSQGDLRNPLPLILVGGVLWSYHTRALRLDAQAAAELPRQAGIRRLYLYLLAGIGLIACLIGLSGDISVLIRSLSGQPFLSTIREQLAWFTAALITGLPIWLWPWRQAQVTAELLDATGVNERASLVRRIYLYLFLFIAALALLTSGIYIVSQLIELALGARTSASLVTDLAQAIAFALIALLVWLYHMTNLRHDGRLLDEQETNQLQALRVAFVNQPGPGLAAELLAALPELLPQVTFDVLPLTEGAPPDQETVEALQQAKVIVGPWTMVAGQEVGPEWSTAIANSPARKLLIPVHDTGWDWIGLRRESAGRTTKQLATALRQMAASEEITPSTPLGIGSILAIIAGVLVLLSVLIPLIVFLIEEVF